MKKFGFTLSELLVALAIVAVASALMAPAFTKMMPDKYKTRVLKYYSMVANATNDMLDNQTIYYALDTNSNNEPDCTDLECTGQPLVAPYNTDTKYSGANKYKNILADMLDLQPSGQNYMSPDGAIWEIVFDSNSSTATINITFPRGTSTCAFSTSCSKPNKYIFSVSKNGEVSPYDAMTDAYLHNPENRDKSVDVATANGYLNDENKPYNESDGESESESEGGGES